MQDSGSAEELIDLEQRRCAFMVGRRLEELDTLFSKHLIYTHGTGARESKASFLDKLRTGALVFLHWDAVVEDARVVGDMGYVVGHHSAEVAVAGVTKQLQNHFLSVWHRGAMGWQFCAYQPTAMRKLIG